MVSLPQSATLLQALQKQGVGEQWLVYRFLPLRKLKSNNRQNTFYLCVFFGSSKFGVISVILQFCIQFLIRFNDFHNEVGICIFPLEIRNVALVRARDYIPARWHAFCTGFRNKA